MKRLAAPILTSILASGCLSFEVAKGNGTIKEETRTVKAFDEVEVTAGMNLAVTFGEEQKVTVRADENLQAVIKSDVVESRLVFQIDAVGIEPTEPVQIHVQVKALRFAGASGGGKLSLQGVPTRPELRLQAVYGSTLEATGAAEDLYVLLTEGSQGQLGGLAANDVHVDLRNGSQGEVSAAASIDGTLRDGSSLTVRGGPAERSIEALGGSTITWEP